MAGTHEITELKKIWLIRLFLLWTVSAVPIVAAAQPNPDRIALISERLDAIERTLGDQLSNAAQIQRAASELQALIAEAQQISDDKTDQDSEEGDPVVRLQARLHGALRLATGRVAGDKTFRDRDGQEPFPVPDTEGDAVTDKAGRLLIAAQQELAEQLRRTPVDEQAVGRLLTAMILAEEDLAWEAGWPYTRDEARAVRAAGGLTADAYRSRLNRGIERLNGWLSVEAEIVGRSLPRRFVIHQPISRKLQQQVTSSLARKRGQPVAAVWSEGARPFDEKERRVLLGAR